MACPSDEELARVAAGEALASVASHCVTCDACAAVIDAIRASDAEPFAPEARELVAAEPVPGMSVGRYVILGRIGRGGMGVVFQAYDAERDRVVALKLMRTDASNAPEPARIQRFKREFRAASDLHHPNLVRLGELLVDGGRWCFTMELVRGVDLLSYVAGDHGRLRAVLRQVVSALAMLHRAGIVHRDVKPSNVLVEPGGRAVLLDFGIALERTDVAHEQGHVVGTASYMAPEQIRGEAVGPAADWYALGVMMFAALTGRAPFEGTVAQIMRAKLAQAGPAPSQLVDEIPPELDALCARLMALDPQVRPGVDEIVHVLRAGPEPASASPTPFVGRDAVLAELTAHLEESRSRIVVATVEGEPGIGKTTLVDHAVARWRAASPELLALRGRCHTRERIPYNAFDGVIDDLARELSRLHVDPQELGELGRMFPSIATAASSPPSGEGRAPLAARGRAFAALRSVLDRISGERPVVVVLDDAQWADVDSLAVLAALIAPPSAPRLLILMTVRSHADRRWEPPPWLTGVTRHHLAGLGVHEVAMIASAIGHAGIDHARLRDETHGNPMLLEQCLSVPRDLDAASHFTLASAIDARATQLSANAAAVLDVLAVAGHATSSAITAAAAQLDLDQLDAAVAELGAMRFARRESSRTDALDVFHERIRDEVYRALGPRSGELHAHLGEVLVATRGAPDAIAMHLALAGQRSRAAGYARIAAEAAERALAFDRAAELYRQAIDGGDPSDALTTRLASALADAGRPLEAADAYRQAAAATRDPAQRQELRRRAAEQVLAGGYLDRGLTEAAALLAETGGGRIPRRDVDAVLALLAGRARLSMRPLRWRPRSEQELPQEILTRLDLHWSLSIGLASVDSLRGALFAIRLPLLCLEHGEEQRIARALCAAAVSYAGMGSRNPTERLLAAADRAAESHGSPLARFYAGLGHLASSFLLDNDWRATCDHGERLTKLWQMARRGRGWELDTVEQWTLFSQLWLGRFRAVHARVDALAARAADGGDRFHEVGLRAYFGVLDALLGDPAECERNVAGAMARSNEERSNLNQRYWAWRSRTYASMYRGDVERCSDDLERAWASLRTSLLLRIPTVAAEAHAAVGGFAITRAALARAGSDRRRHLSTARRAARRLRRNGLLAGELAYHTLEAGIAHVAGEHERAVEVLRTAEAMYAAAAMEGQLAATRLHLGEALGGSEGARLRGEALAWFERERVPDARQTAALLSPGWHA